MLCRNVKDWKTIYRRAIFICSDVSASGCCKMRLAKDKAEESSFTSLPHIYLRAACPQQNPAGTYSSTTSGSTSRRMAELCTAVRCRAREPSRPRAGPRLRSPSSARGPFTPHSNADFRAPRSRTRVPRAPGPTYRGQQQDGTGRERSRGALPAVRPRQGGGAAERGAGSGEPRLRLCSCPAWTGRGRPRAGACGGGGSFPCPPAALSPAAGSPRRLCAAGTARPSGAEGRADKGCGLVPALGRDGAARRLRRLGGASQAGPGRAGRERHMVRGWCPALRTRGRAEGPPWTTSWRR